jgi:hypothetical protein
MEVRTTQDSILRAFALLVQQKSNPRPIKRKYVYRSFGSAVHAARCLTKAEGAAVDAVVDKLKALDPKDDANTKAVEGLLKELSKLPVKFVPVKLEQRIDRSKSYPYRSTKRGG